MARVLVMTDRKQQNPNRGAGAGGIDGVAFAMLLNLLTNPVAKSGPSALHLVRWSRLFGFRRAGRGVFTLVSTFAGRLDRGELVLGWVVPPRRGPK